MAHGHSNGNRRPIGGFPARHLIGFALLILFGALLTACGSADGTLEPDAPAARADETDSTPTSTAEITSTSTSTTVPSVTTPEPSTTTVPASGSSDRWDLSVVLWYEVDEENYIEWSWGGDFSIDGSGRIQGSGLGSIVGSGACRMWTNGNLEYKGPPQLLLGGFGVQISGEADGDDLDLAVTGADAFASFEETDPNCETEFWGMTEDFAAMIAEIAVNDLVPDRRLVVPAETNSVELAVPEFGTLTVTVTEP